MALTKERKQEICDKYGESVDDVGSSQVQIALMTERINILTKHLSDNKKDFTSRRGLFVLIGKRSRLLSYLKERDRDVHDRVASGLGIRIKKSVSRYA